MEAPLKRIRRRLGSLGGVARLGATGVRRRCDRASPSGARPGILSGWSREFGGDFFRRVARDERAGTQRGADRLPSGFPGPVCHRDHWHLCFARYNSHSVMDLSRHRLRGIARCWARRWAHRRPSPPPREQVATGRRACPTPRTQRRRRRDLRAGCRVLPEAVWAAGLAERPAHDFLFGVAASTATRQYLRVPTREQRRNRRRCPVCGAALARTITRTRFERRCRSCQATLQQRLTCPHCQTRRVWQVGVDAFCHGCGHAYDPS